jgi:hypothetical protein
MRATSRIACRVGYALWEHFLVVYFMCQLFPTENPHPTSGHSYTVSPSAKATQTETCGASGKSLPSRNKVDKLVTFSDVYRNYR